MELHMHSHHWEARKPDWMAAAVAGFLGGAVLMVLELFWSTMVLDISPWTGSNMVAAIALGSATAQATAYSFAGAMLALLTHYVLGIAFGMALAAVIAPFHFDSSTGMALLTGAVYGLVLYLFNFYGMTRFFPWFAELRGWATLLSQIAFGMTVALMYTKLERQGEG
ncbi:MAG: hypothetical protein HYZ65_08050 [Burkholderiales bacterium]|nr:hypothetical protein [Burkholderiales bacterium]